MNTQVTKTVQWVDLKPMVDEALNQIMDFHIAFIKITRTKIEEKVFQEDASLLGSGTLVSTDKRRGILTS